MSSKKKTPLVAVGVDDGFFNTKLYLGNGNDLIIPSRGRLGAAKRISFMGTSTENPITEYKTNDVVYTIGGSESDSIIHDDYPTSNLNRVIVHHALKEAGLGSQDVAIRTGLPLRKYYIVSDVARNEKLIAKKEANFKQQVFVNHLPNEHTANIKHHSVGPEAASVLYDYVIEEKANVKGGFIEHLDRLQETIAIIDIGGKTTDICIFEAGDIVIDSIETIDAGIHNVYNSLRGCARDNLCVDRVPDKLIDNMYETGTLTVGNKSLDITNVLNDAKMMVGNDIIQSVTSIIGSKAGFIDRILFVGGGSEVLAKQLRDRFEKEFRIEKPVMANARGLYKALKTGILPNYEG